MAFITSAIGAAALIGGGLGLAGSLVSANASRSAANKQADAANRGIDTQLQMFDRTRADLAPWMQGGQTGYAQLMRLLGLSGTPENPTFDSNALLVKPFGMSDFQTDPGYQFRLHEGLNAITNKRSAMGGVLSGNTLKELENYGQGLASQEYGNAYNRYRQSQGDIYNRISGISDTGVNAAGGVAKLGSNVADNVSSLQYAQGAAGASGDLGAGRALSQGANTVSNWLLASYLQNRGSAGGNNWVSQLPSQGWTNGFDLG